MTTSFCEFLAMVTIGLEGCNGLQELLIDPAVYTGAEGYSLAVTIFPFVQ